MENIYSYKEIPNYNRFVACSDGFVYRKATNMAVPGWRKNDKQCPAIQIRDNKGVKSEFHLGKLILDTFGVVYPYDDRPWVRHRDNDLSNTALDNLYWEGNYTGVVPEEERHLFKPYYKNQNILSAKDGRICNEKCWVYRLKHQRDSVGIMLLDNSGEKYKFQKVTAATIVASTWLNYPLDSKEWPIKYKDGDTFNLAADNLEVITNTVPESELHLFTPTFLYPDLSVSRCGRVMNNVNLLEYSTDSKAGDYIKIYYKINGKRKPVKIHRLVAMTYLPLPEDYKTLEVNHINGIRYDNRVENLEWVTTSGNQQHAFATGLNQSSTGCLLIRNGEVTRFKSLNDVGRCLMVGSQRLGTLIKKPTSELQIITYADKDAVVTSLSGLALIPSNLPVKLYNQAIVVYNILTGEVQIHDNAKKVGKILGMSAGSIWGRANSNSDYPFYNYVFRWGDSVKQRPIRKFTEQEVAAFKDKAVVSPVMALLPNGEEKLHASVKEANDGESVNRSSINEAIRTGRPVKGVYFRRYI